MNQGDVNHDDTRNSENSFAGGFVDELTAWRKRRRMSKASLAERMGYDASYVSHVEAGRHPGSADFVRRADAALDAGGEIWRAWQTTGDTPAVAADGSSRALAASPAPPAPPSGLVVEDDFAELTYANGLYTATQRRRLFNAGAEPVTRYLMRISVDRYPGDPDRSNQLYRQRPLTWDELGLVANCDGRSMRQRVKVDRDALKEVWLCFENDTSRFPLYPGQQATVTYSYRVDDHRWGPWFQRAVRLPTRRLGVQLTFPTAFEPAVWGTETSTTTEATPLRTPIAASNRPDGTTRYSWSTDDPPMGARYRLEWSFNTARQPEPARPDLRRSSDRMKAAGIIQRGDPVLTAVSEPFHLPAEGDQARELIDQLLNAIQRVSEHHEFAKGMGLAAPQIGVARSAAIVIPPGVDSQPLVLLNARIIDAAPKHDEQYEGCLSFFDHRGLVPRSRRIEVEHTTLDGQTTISVFEDSLARLAAHEIDHLDGRLYIDRMNPDTRLISVEEYRGTGTTWSYG